MRHSALHKIMIRELPKFGSNMQQDSSLQQSGITVWPKSSEFWRTHTKETIDTGPGDGQIRSASRPSLVKGRRVYETSLAWD